ncbi:MAG TPA: hypothetical protein VK116_02910, partial [Planctomycetota bacterium]|nr:hypothetical protein [Planctomycetota bacterium]
MRDRELAGQEGAQGGVRGTPSEPEEGRASDHALVVLEYERIREVLSSYAASILGRQIAARVSPLKDISRVEALLRETQEMRDLLRTERLALQGLQDVAAELREVVTYGRVAEPPFLYRVVEMIDAGKSARAKLTAS